MEYQSSLPGIPAPRVIELTLRFGLIVEEGHGQWQLEVRNPLTGELLGMASRPHFDLANLSPECSRAVLRLRDAARELLDGGAVE